jgi:tetratricopeptide (TPR) repeat protein
MTRRSLAALAALSCVLAGLRPTLQAQAGAGARLFVDGNALYAAQRYAEAVTAYRAALAAEPSLGEAHFFLANALDNQFVPARRGQPANDQLLEDAREHYTRAAALLAGSEHGVIHKRSLQFLAALYGRDKLNRPEEAEAVIRQLIALDPGDTGSFFALAKILEDAGRSADAETVLLQAQAAAPNRADVWSQTAQFYNRSDRFDEAMAAMARVAELNPVDPQPFYQLAVFYEEKVRKAPARQTGYLRAATEAVDRALALRPEYFEALVYKNLILRQQARFAGDPQAQRMLLEEADRLQQQALQVRNRQSRGRPVP